MKTFLSAALFSLTLSLASVSFSAEHITTKITSATKEFSPGYVGDLEKIVASHKGEMGLYIKNLKTGDEYNINGDEPFPTASTIKTATMAAAFAALDSDKSPFKDYYDSRPYDDKTSASGSGIIKNFKNGTKVELKELVHLMITVSDNVATNMLSEWVTLDYINKWLAENGFIQTRQFSTIGGSSIWDAKGRKEWGLGRTTPKEMATLMEMIATNKAGTPAACDEMLRILGHQYFDDKIGVQAPPMIYVGSKSGAVNDSRSDSGIVASAGGTYVIAVYTKNNVNRAWDNTNEAEIAIKKIANLTYNHFNPEHPWTPVKGTEKY